MSQIKLSSFMCIYCIRNFFLFVSVYLEENNQQLKPPLCSWITRHPQATGRLLTICWHSSNAVYQIPWIVTEAGSQHQLIWPWQSHSTSATNILPCSPPAVVPPYMFHCCLLSFASWLTNQSIHHFTFTSFLHTLYLLMGASLFLYLRHAKECHWHVRRVHVCHCKCLPLWLFIHSSLPHCT